MSSLGVFAKLIVGASGDRYEQEADRVALQVMAMPDPAIKPQSIQRQSQEDETLQKQSLVDSIIPVVQRQKEEHVQAKPSVQRTVNGGAFEASFGLESRLASQKGGGSPLPDEVRSFMEPRFGSDFTGVRVHTGSEAVQMNRELGAQAFTHGSDIYFNEGKYNPGTNSGKHLLAHELTHVIQQTAGIQLNKQLHQEPKYKKEEQASLQAKKLPSHTLTVTPNKELRLKPTEKKEEQEPLRGMRLLQAIGYLVDAAKQMPDHFMEQLSEEILGMNLSEPLPFERSSAACGKGSSVAALLNKTKLTENDIAVEQVVPFDVNPEFLASLNLKDGGEVEFGESNHPTNSMQAIRAELADGESQGKASTAAGGEMLITECDDEQTTEAKLQELMAQKPSGASQTDKQGQPAQQGDIPESLKTIGPLTVAQRARYMSHQMMQGVKQWFSANWPKLLVGAIAALTAFIGLNILTGGAIMAALPPLMQVFGAVMGGVALANIAGHIRDYLTKGWAGKVVDAAKSLARGLAAGAVELVFALLFNAGAVIKAFKGGLKGTALAVAGAAKNTVKTTVKSVKELGEIGLKGAKTAIKNGKIMLQGLKGGFSKGAKSLDDLARQLVGKLRFNKFKIRRQGRRIQLLGHINPWIVIADGEIRTEGVTKDTPGAIHVTDDQLELLQNLPSNGFTRETQIQQVREVLNKGSVSQDQLKKLGFSNDQLKALQRTKEDAKAAAAAEKLIGKFKKAKTYHGDTRHNMNDAVVKNIMDNPDGVYFSQDGETFIFHKGGDVAIMSARGSTRGNILTAYGDSGIKGPSGVKAYGGLPTDQGPPVTASMIINGQIPTGSGFNPPAAKIWP